MKCSMDIYVSMLSRRTPAKAFDRVREWDREIIKLKGVDGNGGQFLFGSDKHSFDTCPNNSQMCFLEEWMFSDEALFRS